MDRNFYREYYYFERNHWWFRARRNILIHVLKSLPLKTDSDILNVGEATGASGQWLSDFGKVTSVESDEECYRFLTHEFSGREILNASVINLPLADNQFHLVCAFDVLEHVKDDFEAASEMIRVCKPGGYVVITVPAHKYLWSRHDDVNHHHRRYSKNELKKLFLAGGTILFVSPFNFLLFPFIATYRILNRYFFGKFFHSGSYTESDFSVASSGWLNKILFGIMESEKKFLKHRIPLLAGISLLLIFKKDEVK